MKKYMVIEIKQLTDQPVVPQVHIATDNYTVAEEEYIEYVNQIAKNYRFTQSKTSYGDKKAKYEAYAVFSNKDVDKPETALYFMAINPINI